MDEIVNEANEAEGFRTNGLAAKDSSTVLNDSSAHDDEPRRTLLMK